MGRRVLVALLTLHAAALYLFTTGFFLTRFEVADLSSCQVSLSDTNAVPTHLRGGHEETFSPEGCWMPRRFRRIVFVVIDALRFDFAATGSSAQHSSFYSDRLPIFNDTLTHEPEHSLLLKFVADPPTMTMQRLKGLTTGSLPTFLDIKDNMAASSQIVEDNLLHQLRAQQRGVIFMGDDTWDSLYAREFTRKFAFDSFNVKDLHSVDRGVTAHLFPELQKPDWDLLIAHFLGVDHVGHTHGPSSAFMAEKLDEMNGVLEKLLQTLKDMPDGDDVLLAVLGDHGMSADGNHGGASDEETGAALFLYSKGSLVVTGGEDDSKEGNDLRKFAEKIRDSSREVPQVDLVPTLALLSGLPIPFGNLGSIIPSLFFVSSPSNTGENTALTAFETLNRALRLNLDQVRRYLFRYSSASKLPERAYDQLEKLFADIRQVEEQLEQVQGSDGNPSYVKADLPLLFRLHEDLAKQQQHYLREALSLGRSIWTQFDLCSMGWGMLILTWAFIIGVVSTRVIEEDSWSPSLGLVIVTGGLFLLFPASINLPLLPAAPLSRALAVAASTGLVDMTRQLASRLKSTPRSVQGSGACVRNLSPSMPAVISTVVVVLHALALLSNSYIVAEGSVMQFLSATTGFFLLACSQRLDVNRNAATAAALAFIISARLSSALEPPNIIKATTTLERTFAPLAAIAILAVASSTLTPKYTGQKPSRLERVLLAASLMSLCACAVFWAVSPINVKFWRLWLPRFVYLVFLGGGVGVLVDLRQSRKKGSGTSAHPLLFWLLVPAFMLVLGPTSPLSVLCLVVQCLSFAFVITCRRSISPATFGSSTPWVLLWASCSYQAFFTTGHANTFTSLQNAAGFVGFDTFNFYAAGVLLGLNTFGCLALAVLALPWLNLTQHQLKAEGESQFLLAFSAYFSLNALVSTLFVALQRRHLMVWAIFAPKFIYDGVVLLITEVLLLLLLAPFCHNQSSVKKHRLE
ncbi:GPI ethanolamine phosphate transferase 3 [Phytophthora citrophthora]|uniref:GPI ethanolamine phosphate transferase 3 n=1 Tax=Phytophthora citrophthora TaxID=4793 RepID=A0AAD9GWJ3_9STRA|nr:GPI ethanolamine phosphate transferase 3 [Phytophthora citrophthora]